MTVTTLAVLDLAGVFVFALSGALAGVHARLDVFGVLVVGTGTAIGGGLMRDVLLGATPPAALQNWVYLAVPLAASLIVFVWHPRFAALRRPMLVLDAAGLGLFTVTGTQKALDLGLGPAGACTLGALAGFGGGLLRDVLLGEIPLVLRRDIYALPAIAGAVIVAIGNAIGGVLVAWQIAAVGLVFAVRMTALARRWSLPAPRGLA
ncbi:trimeric intracellular cation channel family protein [Skermania piniformis]|uniref:Trimeric intracellular cation channel family protein n=1 Tax=Skermania pinensis TaxID=39122 RepID=A0ABX8SCD2_9ACTN|nr:trimeric intracellular cation channel family protein [Skermania piniformis]QXQ15086.1 trimeric intracellular cation channel family protein [Skermania piniformis]